MNIVYLGSSGPLSVIPLRYLVASGHKLLAVGVSPASSSSLQDFSSPIIAGLNESVEMLARIHDVPVITLSDSDSACIQAIKNFRPDIIISSCFEKKLPADLLAIPEAGCFNLHPSLLPAFRGPVPLFWQFRQGIEQFGISLHRMNNAFDAGPIVSQRTTTMLDGVSNEGASVRLATIGVDLLKDFLDKLDRGIIDESVQNESLATHMGLPSANDFSVSTSWSARRIYNFMCATSHWGQTYPCTIMRRSYELEAALSFQPLATARSAFIEADSIRFACQPGILTARFKSAR